MPSAYDNRGGVPPLRVNQHIMHGHFWSPSHFAASCGGAPLNIIRQYIEQQRHPANATSGLTPP